MSLIWILYPKFRNVALLFWSCRVISPRRSYSLPVSSFIFVFIFIFFITELVFYICCSFWPSRGWSGSLIMFSRWLSQSSRVRLLRIMSWFVFTHASATDFIIRLRGSDEDIFPSVYWSRSSFWWFCYVKFQIKLWAYIRGGGLQSEANLHPRNGASFGGLYLRGNIFGILR